MENLFEWQPENIMTLEQLREHEWVVPWSGGKDSTATILLMVKYNIPIKKIFNVRMMYDETTPAVIPLMTDFVDYAAKVFHDNYGLDVDIVKSIHTAKEEVTRIYKKSKYPGFVGKPYGFISMTRGMCSFQQEKPKTQDKVLGKNDFVMIGYGCDELRRFSHYEETETGLKFVSDKLDSHHQSLLMTLGWTEKMAYDLCKSEGLLSPHYEEGITRDGCWFCPNSTKTEIERIKVKYPELYKKVEWMYNLNKKLHSTDVINTKNRWANHFNTLYDVEILKIEDVKNGLV